MENESNVKEKGKEQALILTIVKIYGFLEHKPFTSLFLTVFVSSLKADSGVTLKEVRGGKKDKKI